MSDIVKRLREKIIVDAFTKGSISDGALCDRLIRERLDAADEIERLREVLKSLLTRAPDNAHPEDYDWLKAKVENIRAARKALGETDD